jgi:hypothetical protein
MSEERFSESSLYGHLSHHDLSGLRRRLLRMCDDQDAHTIRASIKRMPADRFERRIAKALAKILANE